MQPRLFILFSSSLAHLNRANDILALIAQPASFLRDSLTWIAYVIVWCFLIIYLYLWPTVTIIRSQPRTFWDCMIWGQSLVAIIALMAHVSCPPVVRVTAGPCQVGWDSSQVSTCTFLAFFFILITELLVLPCDSLFYLFCSFHYFKNRLI